MHFNYELKKIMTVDPAWYGFGTVHQQNMQQVQYLS
jgi:hypothetical protein